MDIKRGLRGKKRIIISTIIATILLLIGFKIIFTNILQYINLQTEEKMIKISQILANQIDGDSHERFVKNNNIEDDFSIEINNLLLDVKEKFTEIINIYTVSKADDSDIWRLALTSDRSAQNKITQSKRRASVQTGIYKIYLGSIVGDNLIYREKNSPVSIYRSIYNSSGQQVAILGIDLRESMAVDWIKKLLKETWALLIITILILGLISMRAIDNILKPIGLLVEESKEIRWKKRLYFSEDTCGELELLVKEFNKVLQKKQHEKEGQQLLIDGLTEEKENIFEVYKDVIQAVTQNKILLLSREAFIQKISGDFALYSTKLVDIQDITRCRREVDNILTLKGFHWWSGKNRTGILLCLSEAITNTIKHAGAGEVLLSIKGCKLTIYILDNGRGIDLKKLPYSIFINGFSTKEASLGTGFLLMERYMDRIVLSTSKEGTFLALEKQVNMEI